MFEDFQRKIVISISFIIVYLIILLNFSISMEWYIINEKSITVKNIYGVINKVERAEFKEVRELSQTERGEGGFGHTGKQ